MIRRVAVFVVGTLAVVSVFAGPWLSFIEAQQVHQAQKTNAAELTATKAAITAQIPALKAQIANDEKTIATQKTDINEAVAAIEKLAAQVEKLGGNPGSITIGNGS